MKRRGIFRKIFLYTTLLLVLTVGLTAALFSQQVISFYQAAHREFLRQNLSVLMEELSQGGIGEYPQIAQAFFERNQTFRLIIQGPQEQVIFTTGHVLLGVHSFNFVTYLTHGHTLYASHDFLDVQNYNDLMRRVAVALVLLFAMGVIFAIVFARQMTSPIKTLVGTAHEMAALAPIVPPAKRSDEIGELTDIMHEMYGKLKDTITALEAEKEAQQYFFVAASHELKTPIAATTALLQGMFDNIGDYQDHPKYLWECLKMMNEQNKIVTEILEIVKYTNSEPKSVNLPLRKTIEDLLPVYQPLLDKKNITASVEIPEAEYCIADYDMLHKALSNVILNAIQHSDGEVRIWSEVSDNFIKLQVLNTGSSIDENMELFKPFARMSKARSHDQGRSGLGLTIVAKMLDTMNIRYGLKNADEGVIFWAEIVRVK